jgi:hypothetical protein
VSSIRWQYRDEGSGGPGHLQAVAPSGAYATYASYRAFMAHVYGCDDCEFGDTRCPRAKWLWATYAQARDAAA